MDIHQEDIVVAIVCELVAVPLCHASWEAIVAGNDILRGIVGLAFGLPIGVAGLTFHWWKGRISRITDAAVYWWPIAIVLAFAYVCGPAIYRRSQQPSPSIIAKAVTDAVAPIQSQLKDKTKETGDLSLKLAESDRQLSYAVRTREEAERDSLSTKKALSDIRNATPQSLPSDIATIADLTRQRDALRSQLTEAGKVAAPPVQKSPILGLDDAKRFQLIKSPRDSIASLQNGRLVCHTMTHEQPSSRWGEALWSEIAVIMSNAGWQLEGGRTPKAYFPPGITLYSSKDAGDGFNCAFRLSELLLGLQVPTTLRVNQVSPDLVACERENPSHGCVEIVIADPPASGAPLPPVQPREDPNELPALTVERERSLIQELTQLKPLLPEVKILYAGYPNMIGYARALGDVFGRAGISPLLQPQKTEGPDQTGIMIAVGDLNNLSENANRIAEVFRLNGLRPKIVKLPVDVKTDFAIFIGPNQL